MKKIIELVIENIGKAIIENEGRSEGKSCVMGLYEKEIPREVKELRKNKIGK